MFFSNSSPLRSEKQVGGYIKVLREHFRVIDRLQPMFATPTSRNGRFYITDNFLRSWLAALQTSPPGCEQPSRPTAHDPAATIRRAWYAPIVMAEPHRKRATYQDVLDAPAHQVAEIVNGELHLSPRPAGPHAAVSSALGGSLMPPFDWGRGGPGGWIILFEPELHLGDDVLVPDLAGWRCARMTMVANEPFFTIVPDWICEVLSPSTEKLDRADKLAIYSAAGVGHAWLVNPRLRTLEVLRLHEGRWLALGIYRDDARVRVEPFEAIELELALLWKHLGPPLRAAELAARYGEAAESVL